MTILEIINLQQSYGAVAPVLRGISFKVEQGEFVGIIGLSGSGKSTLLRCINRLVDATSGKIIVPASLLGPAANGKPIDILKLNATDLRHMRRKIGMIFQQFNIVKRLSVMENVLSGGLGYQSPVKSTLRLFSREDQRHALVNLKRVGLLDLAYKRADELSGGEQQRVAIARTLMQQPAIILADEPVSSLDPKLSRVILDILQRVCREDGITALVSLHTLELTREYADRVIGLKDGQIFFDGPTQELSNVVVNSVYEQNDSPAC
ncbi:MAG TPA: phosphonate ABC transporter ATP-binding protein [Candidatus Limnocylindrales bacterium]|nr:phosphonate ABC transporter ATP-binding protein [Candidatus Limnocylindrales bacterium]